MSVSSYYEVMPQVLLDRLTSDPELLSALNTLWGHGSGMQYWFDQIEESELEEIMAEHSEATVKTLRELVSRIKNFPSAYIKKLMILT
ncbi:MAG: hypothetical protein AAFQ89_01000 [Cyanobacteria bacterium J06626_18]